MINSFKISNKGTVQITSNRCFNNTVTVALNDESVGAHPEKI